MFKTLSAKFKKIKNAFSKLKFQLGKKLKGILSKKLDESSYEELERLFYESDLGAELSIELVNKVQDILRKKPDIDSDEILQTIREELQKVLGPAPTVSFSEEKPHVILVVGTNGSGKTTTIAKLAKHYSNMGKRVLISASDTFRAAAIDQLATWAERLGIDIIRSSPGADPSSVVFDTMNSATSKGYDLVLIDTAGRLHTKTDLMGELEKIRRVCKKHVPSAPHETLLVIDATCGQNAMDQAEIFHSYTPISSLVLTKLDGTAKGGIVVALKKQKDLSVHWVGIGEKPEDLMLFDPDAFLDALFQTD